MADKRKISMPRGCVVSSNGQTAQLIWNPDFTPRRTKQFSNCQKYVDEAVLKYSSPFVPMETGVLDKSGILGTDVGSGEVQYITPYAAKLYRHPEYSFSTRYHQLAQAEWFEAMKKQHRDEILAAAATYFD